MLALPEQIFGVPSPIVITKEVTPSRESPSNISVILSLHDVMLSRSHWKLGDSREASKLKFCSKFTDVSSPLDIFPLGSSLSLQ